jgi:crossover junction endodeoxyribonuclease RusA
MNVIKFYVEGDPRAQPRARVYNKIAVSAPRKNPIWSWREAITIAAKEHRPENPIDGPIHLVIEFKMRRPRSHYRTGKYSQLLKPNAPDWHINIPDLDNLEKAVMDTLTQLSFWHDDRQVAAKTTYKKWATIPHMYVALEQL